MCSMMLRARNSQGKQWSYLAFPSLRRYPFSLMQVHLSLVGSTKMSVPMVCTIHQITSPHLCCAPLTSAPVKQGSPVPAQAMNTWLCLCLCSVTAKWLISVLWVEQTQKYFPELQGITFSFNSEDNLGHTDQSSGQ